MLLYDRVYSAAHHANRKRGVTESEAELYGLLSRSTVYELSNVVPLFDDWQRDRGKPIPKRAPGPVTWCEWRHEEATERSRTNWQRGVLIRKCEACDVPPTLRPNGTGPDDLVYVVEGFQLIEASDDPELADWPRHQAMVVSPANKFAFRKTGEYVGARLLVANDQLARWQSRNCLGLPLASYTTEGGWHPQDVIWPPFMAFSLLHCRNVVTESHATPEQVQRKVRKSGNPPRVTYKTISIRVPETHGPRLPSDPDPDAEKSVRFHLCRGHFKNLTNPRYKNRGLHWWPAHWRGNPEAGAVITERHLEPAA